MAAKPNPPDLEATVPNSQRLAELASLVDAVKDRVRAQYPDTTATGPAGAICVGLPDLTPLARARDAAAGKMAAIGTVNPRPGGLVNNSIQSLKRAVSRALNWFVRDQVVFNRQMVVCIETCLESLAEVNRTIHTLAGQANIEVQRVREETEPLRVEARTLRAKTSELQDLASHWHRWREEWQLKLHKNEVEFLKSVADLNTAVQQKLMYGEAASHQRAAAFEQKVQELHVALERHVAEMQAAWERNSGDLLRSFQRDTGTLDAAFQKTATELDASYRQTATQLEAACRQVSADVESRFAQTVVPLEAGFRESLTQSEASFERRVSQVEQDTAASLRSQHDAFEQLVGSNAEALERSMTRQIAALDERMVKEAREFEQLLATSIGELQKKFYGDLDRIRSEYERIIHAELRIVRQRLSASAEGTPAVPAPSKSPHANTVLPFDYARFADRFRGSEEYVMESQRFYLPYFANRRHVLDLGCGRGEFLRLMKEAGVPARGIEASEESVAYCRSLHLDATRADLFEYLSAQPEGSLDGIFCSQVVEHLPADRLPELVRLCAGRLATSGILTIETPNPECLAIFATHFYLDPTHTRPVPSQLLAFYMEEFGLGRIEVHGRAPAVETMPEVGELPSAFREKFFAALDYAIIARKL